MRFAYSTVSLKLDFLAPTAVASTLTLRARVTALDGDRATVSTTVFVDGQETTRAESEHVRLALA